jgi:hypothetical protein
MAGKTRSAKQEGNHGPGWPAPPPGSVEEACRLHERAVALREHGQHAEAATCARYALASFEREYGPDHPDVANILNNLAGIYADQGYYTEAARLAQRSVTIMEQTTGKSIVPREAMPSPSRSTRGHWPVRKLRWAQTTSKQPPALMTPSSKSHMPGCWVKQPGSGPVSSAK